MPKVLDVTVRMVEYTPSGYVVLPYTEHRVIYETIPESLQIGQDDLSICRHVAENCLQVEPLFPAS
ncbi:MAG: hypothetical protein EBV74_06765 [Alphaproteobacteria bacterium]|nr:hypothetical protein [Candidatus Fonsibacter sp. PEL55]